jgi:hypothetical protein
MNAMGRRRVGGGGVADWGRKSVLRGRVQNSLTSAKNVRVFFNGFVAIYVVFVVIRFVSILNCKNSIVFQVWVSVTER